MSGRVAWQRAQSTKPGQVGGLDGRGIVVAHVAYTNRGEVRRPTSLKAHIEVEKQVVQAQRGWGGVSLCVLLFVCLPVACCLFLYSALLPPPPPPPPRVRGAPTPFFNEGQGLPHSLLCRLYAA